MERVSTIFDTNVKNLNSQVNTQLHYANAFKEQSTYRKCQNGDMRVFTVDEFDNQTGSNAWTICKRVSQVEIKETQSKKKKKNLPRSLFLVNDIGDFQIQGQIGLVQNWTACTF